MSKKTFKEIVFVIILTIINTIVAFMITNKLGITNKIILKTYTAMFGDISYEIILVWAFSLIKGLIYEYWYPHLSTKKDLPYNRVG